MKIIEYLMASAIGLFLTYLILSAINKYFPDNPKPPQPHNQQRIILQGSHDGIV